jgi:hypothetical protein
MMQAMNRMKGFGSVGLIALWLVVFTGSSALAQLPISEGAFGMSVAMLKLFGSVTAFTANARVRVSDASGKESLRAPMTFDVRDGRLRMDLDMAQIQSGLVPAGAVAGLQQFGLSRLAVIVRPDKKDMLILYPDSRSYVSMPLSSEDLAAAGASVRAGKRSPEKAVVDGHVCAKNILLLKSKSGAVLLEAVTWNTGDLKGFPVQIQMKEGGNTALLKLSQIQILRPDSRRFEAPAGFSRYESPQALMFALAKKRLGGAEK